MKRIMIFACLMLLSAALLRHPVSAAEPDYASVYKSSMDYTYNKWAQNKDDYGPYGRIGYTYYDLDQDGYLELLVYGKTAKFGGDIYVYSYNGSFVKYYGKAPISLQSSGIWGYGDGFLCLSQGGGFVEFYWVRMQGDSLETVELYSRDKFDAYGNPYDYTPGINDLTAYYDTVYLREKAPEWKEYNGTLSAPEKSTAPSSSILLYCQANEYVTLRSDASTSAAPLDYVLRGESVEYISSSGDFYQVRYKNQVGYVLASYFTTTWPYGTNEEAHDLTRYGYRKVKTNGQGNLVFQTEPGGSFMKDYSFSDGDSIFVHLTWREKGYTIAYKDGVYGFVDAGYIDWSSSGGSAYDPHNLSDFGYRTVRTDGRGALVFQTEPGGSFLKDYSYWNGDSIYVNLTWREKGYALAYKNGVYGYVDASYINW